MLLIFFELPFLFAQFNCGSKTGDSQIGRPITIFTQIKKYLTKF